MASRPFAFGLRFRDQETGRTVRVRTSERSSRRYVLEDSRSGGKSRQREHPSLSAALRDFAATWRGRLH